MADIVLLWPIWLWPIWFVADMVAPHLVPPILARTVALEARAPLNPVLVVCQTFKRSQADPLCLPEIIISEYALIVDLHVPTSRRSLELNTDLRSLAATQAKRTYCSE